MNEKIDSKIALYCHMAVVFPTGITMMVLALKGIIYNNPYLITLSYWGIPIIVLSAIGMVYGIRLIRKINEKNGFIDEVEK